MEFKVFNELEIQTFKTDKLHMVISIQDPGYANVTLSKQKSRICSMGMHFHDLDKDACDRGYTIFNKYDAERLLSFIEISKKHVELICVNCVVGISRSSAVAAALSLILNGPGADKYFFKAYCPNMLVYRTILDVYHGKEKN